LLIASQSMEKKLAAAGDFNGFTYQPSLNVGPAAGSAGGFGSSMRSRSPALMAQEEDGEEVDLGMPAGGEESLKLHPMFDLQAAEYDSLGGGAMPGVAPMPLMTPAAAGFTPTMTRGQRDSPDAQMGDGDPDSLGHEISGMHYEEGLN
jgi:hypothetical protein